MCLNILIALMFFFSLAPAVNAEMRPRELESATVSRGIELPKTDMLAAQKVASGRWFSPLKLVAVAWVGAASLFMLLMRSRAVQPALDDSVAALNFNQPLPSVERATVRLPYEYNTNNVVDEVLTLGADWAVEAGQHAPQDTLPLQESLQGYIGLMRSAHQPINNVLQEMIAHCSKLPVVYGKQEKFFDTLLGIIRNTASIKGKDALESKCFRSFANGLQYSVILDAEVRTLISRPILKRQALVLGDASQGSDIQNWLDRLQQLCFAKTHSDKEFLPHLLWQLTQGYEDLFIPSDDYDATLASLVGLFRTHQQPFLQTYDWRYQNIKQAFLPQKIVFNIRMKTFVSSETSAFGLLIPYNSLAKLLQYFYREDDDKKLTQPEKADALALFKRHLETTLAAPAIDIHKLLEEVIKICNYYCMPLTKQKGLIQDLVAWLSDQESNIQQKFPKNSQLIKFANHHGWNWENFSRFSHSVQRKVYLTESEIVYFQKFISPESGRQWIKILADIDVNREPVQSIITKASKLPFAQDQQVTFMEMFKKFLSHNGYEML
jgi:hypothetical protein